MRILLDVTRTLAHRFNSTPTGIDRVEHAFIRWLVNEGRQRFPNVDFLVTTPFVHGAMKRDEMAVILNEVETLWASDRSSNGLHYEKLRALLEQPILQDRNKTGVIRLRGEVKTQSKTRAYRGIAALSIRHAARFRAITSEAASNPTIYLHTSHTQLDEPRLFRWTKKSGIYSAFFIHDLIPIDYPEFCGHSSYAKHKIRMDTVSKYASAILTNSEYTRGQIFKYFNAEGLHLAPVGMAHLANAIQEYDDGELVTPHAKVPYFVHLGTIEGRKNIPHLLNVWRDIVDTQGAENTPRLVIVGRRGWCCENVIQTLERTNQLSSVVIEVSDLKDLELASLLRGSSGLITVSSVEGYGLPPAEALRRGVPVIASDIPAHREVLGKSALFVGVTDGTALREAVLRLVRDEEFRRNRTDLTQELKAISWSSFVDNSLCELLSKLSNTNRH